jgi:hypothetical protein
MKSSRKIIFTTVPSTLLILCLFSFFEWKLRQEIFSWDPNGSDSGPREHGECYQLAPTTGYEPIPNQCNRDENGFYRTWKGEKPEDSYHILVIGDSIADQHKWVAKTVEKMNRLTQGTPRVIASNAGTPGYDTCTELRVLEERGLSVKPDMVLVQYCPNDLAVTATVVPAGTDKVRFYVGWEYTEFPKWILSSRALTYLMLKNLQFQKSESRMRASQSPMLSCFEQIQRLSKEHDFDLHVAAFPVFVDSFDPNQIVVEMQEGRYNSEEVEERSRNIFSDLGLSTTEIRTVFEGHSLVARRNHPTDLWHPDDKGQGIIGEKLGEVLYERYLKE